MELKFCQASDSASHPSPYRRKFLGNEVRYITFTAFLLAIYLGCSTVVVATDETEEHPVYTINPGDQLLITVVGYEKELTAVAVVRPDGMITYPLVGDVEAAGLTIAQLSSAISEELSDLDYYENPQVTVQLREPSQKTIYIIGDVLDPGQKTFRESANIVEALAAAGGYEETADLANARIIKERKEVVPVDLKRLLERDIIDQGVVGDELLSDRFMLENGDVLIIPSAIKEERISVIGHVHQPGYYRVMKPTVSPIEALALAGGPAEVTADLRHVRIIKADGSVVVADVTRAWSETGENQYPSNSLPYQQRPTANVRPSSFVVSPGDSVVVLEKGKVNILGNVKNQGRFAVDGEITVTEALALGGIEEGANLKKLRIVRHTGEEVIVDASGIWKQQGQTVAAWRLSPGDTLIVPRAFRINWSAVSAVVMVFSTLYAIFR